MERAFREPECGAHQTNKMMNCVHKMLGDSDYSYMSKAQITPNDVADATAVCSRDSLKLSRKMSSMCLKSSEFRKSTEFFKVKSKRLVKTRLKIQGDRKI